MDNLFVSKYRKRYTLKLTLNNTPHFLWTHGFDFHDLEHLYYKKIFNKEDEEYIQSIQLYRKSTVGKRINKFELLNPTVDISAWYIFKRTTFKNKDFNVTFIFNENTLLCL